MNKYIYKRFNQEISVRCRNMASVCRGHVPISLKGGAPHSHVYKHLYVSIWRVHTQTDLYKTCAQTNSSKVKCTILLK